MTPIESLQQLLSARFPEASIALDRPRKPSGIWNLDIDLSGHFVNIEWQTGKGFGISCSPEHAYGEKTDEYFDSEEAAFGRIMSLLLSGTYTSPPLAVSLRELRKKIGLSQAELGRMLNKQQGEISKIERRSDVLVSTLSDYARACDCDLQILLREKDGTAHRIQLADSHTRTKSTETVSD
ncbi:helix-turn-helix domain-containing protein [Rubinisphaera sp. JC750]|uniref:helix-turn-helix domain-containing protein n=1 Tax=Rubinisphaera sp. JC750 TaxID=2898658 RepID=UPI001F220D9F|nr:helix-turn-helix transcriptional regulator [Rubinisphaera sp. JC750]